MNGYKIVLLKAIFMLYKLPECERVCSGICIVSYNSLWLIMIFYLLKQNSVRFRISDQPQFFRFVTFYLYFCAGF